MTPGKTYQVTAEIDISALGDNVPAQPDRVFDITAGETVAIDDLPVGAVVTFSEAQPADDDQLTWSTPVISPNPITIEDGHATTPASVTITNHVERTVGTFSIVKSVTGAQAYDHWFAIRPSTTREEFCARVGLPPDRPYLLYLCSSPFIAPREVEFVLA